MKHLPQLCIVFLLFSGTQCGAYNQGSYLFFNLHQDSWESNLTGRIPIDAEKFNTETSAPKKSSLSAEKRSEFEFDFNSFGAAPGNSFDSKPIDFSSFGPNPSEANPAQPTNDISLSE